jgi:hypothetical protein
MIDEQDNQDGRIQKDTSAIAEEARVGQSPVNQIVILI